MTESAFTKYRTKQRYGPNNAPAPEEVAAVKNLAPRIANLRSNIGLLGKAFNVRTQTGFRFAHIVLSLRQHLDRLRNDDDGDDGHGAVDRTPGGKYKLPACLLRKFRSDQASLNNRKKAMPKILVVDDNRIHLACATYSLRKHFLPENVFVATNGREALEIMEHVVVDAIFVAADLPKMNGLEMADVVRHVETQLGQREFKTLIVAMLTPSEAGDDDLLTDCLVAGMDRFCVKPLSIHMHAILDAVTVSGSAVEGFRRKALELQWVSRYPQLQQTLFGNTKMSSSDATGRGDVDSPSLFSSIDNNNNNSPTKSPRSVVVATRQSESCENSSNSLTTLIPHEKNPSVANRIRQLLISDPEDIRRAQETALTLAPDLHDERQMLQLVEKEQRPAIEDIFARERREDTERMQHATSLLRDRIADLERQLAAATGERQKTMESLHIETIARLEKQAEEQRLQIMKLSVRSRELTQRNEKLEEDMRQIIRHGANNARTLRTAFRFIGQVQKKMEKYEAHSMLMEDRSANLSWQNFYGKHFQGTASRKQLEMPAAAEDFSSSWYHEQLDEAHRITSRSNENCASAVVLLGELLDHVQLVRPEMFGATSTSSSGPVAASTASTPAPGGVVVGPEQQQVFVSSPVSSPMPQAPSAVNQQQSAWKTLQRDIESVIHNLSTVLMQNIKDLTEGTKRNVANVCVRELELWKRLARFDKEEDGHWMDLAPRVQDEIHAIVERMKLVQSAKQRRSNETQTESFEAPPWMTSDGAGNEFSSLIFGNNSNYNNIAGAGDRRSSFAGSDMSFMTEVALASKQSGGGGASPSSCSSRQQQQQQQIQAAAFAASNAKEWTFLGLLNKLRPIISFEGFVPLDVRQRAFDRILESVFRLERKQIGDLGEATKRLIREVRLQYSNAESGDEKRRVLLLGDVGSKSSLHFREVLKILNNVTDNIAPVVDAVIVHTLRSIEPSGASSRATKERALALALLEALECIDQEQPIFCPWGEPALVHKIRSGETWDSLEKAFGCSLVEMKRMNATADPPLDFDANPPEPGTSIKLPARPDYIRGKFAHLYHPKTTFSKSGAGDRSNLLNANQQIGGGAIGGGAGGGGKSVGFNITGSPMSQHRGTGFGGGSSRFARDGSSNALNPGMFSSPRHGGSSFLSANAPSGRSSAFLTARQSTMKMHSVGSRGPSRLQQQQPSSSTRAPSQQNFAQRSRGSLVGEAISHFSQEANKVGGTTRERVNARVAQSILTQQSKYTNSNPLPTTKKNSHNNDDDNNKSGSSSPLSREISLALPASRESAKSPGKNTVSNSHGNFSLPNEVGLMPSSFTVSVKVLPTEAPKRLSELAEEYDVTEQEILDANPHLRSSAFKVKKSNNNNDGDDDYRNELNVDDEVQIPVKKEFVVKSLTEARDSQLTEAMKKFLEAAAAKKEAEDAAQGRGEQEENDLNSINNPKSSFLFADRIERSKSKARAAANAAAESQQAADHAAALHRALIEHLNHLEGGDSNNSNYNSLRDFLNSTSTNAPAASEQRLGTNPFSGVRLDSLQKTKLQRVIVDMPVKESASFEQLAQLYGIRGEDLVQANPSLSNPIAAGQTLKVPVNIEEWRDRVAKAALDAQNAADIGVGVQKVDSMILHDGGDDMDMIRLEESHGNATSLPGMGSQASASIRYPAGYGDGGGDIGGGKDNSNNYSNINNNNTNMEEPSDPASILLLLQQDVGNAWSRSEKALFNSVSAALKQKSLIVTVEHQETEYGVTLETIADEYGCGDILGVESRFNNYNDNDNDNNKNNQDNDNKQQQENPVKKEESTATINTESHESKKISPPISVEQSQVTPVTAIAPTGTITAAKASTTTTTTTTSAENFHNIDADKNKKRRNSTTLSIGSQTKSPANNNNDDRNNSNNYSNINATTRQKLFAAARSHAVLEASREIASLNKDNGAVIHDDDDDNSVNPNLLLLVPVPLAAIIRKEISFVIDLQHRCVELAQSIRRRELDASGTPNEVSILAAAPAAVNREGSMGSQFTNGSNSHFNQSPPLQNRKRSDGTFWSGSDNSRSEILELCQVEDMMTRHQEIVATLMDYYFDGMWEKAAQKPRVAQVATMTDNITNILLSSIRSGGPLSFDARKHLQQQQQQQRRLSSNVVHYDQETLERDEILVREAEDERQLAAAAVLLGVDDISKVPAALRNAKFSSIASAFLERLKKRYPMAAAAKERLSARGFPLHNSSSSSPQQQQHSPLNGYNYYSDVAATASSYRQLFGSVTNVDSLKIVGSRAGEGPHRFNEGGQDDHHENFYGQQPRQLGTSFISSYGFALNNNNSNSNNNYGSSATSSKKKPAGARSARSFNAQEQSFFGSSTANMNSRDVGDPRRDLLRQRMQRLGFRASAEALYGDTELIARLHDGGSPLVDNFLRVHGVSSNSNNNNNENYRNDDDSSPTNRKPMNRNFLEALTDGHDYYDSNIMNTASIIQRAARRYDQASEQVWGSANSITGRSAAVTHSSVTPKNSDNQFSKSSPVPGRAARTTSNNNNSRNNTFRQQPKFGDDDDETELDAELDQLRQSSKNQTAGTLQKFTPVPPPPAIALARSGILAQSQSPRVGANQYQYQQQQQQQRQRNQGKEWKTKIGTGERKIEMYAEDKKGAIERFTSRLMEIMEEDRGDNSAKSSSSSPTKKFISSPTSLAGGGGGGSISSSGGGGGIGASGGIFSSSSRISPARGGRTTTVTTISPTRNAPSTTSPTQKASFARSVIVEGGGGVLSTASSSLRK